jgi:hypothetical protein
MIAQMLEQVSCSVVRIVVKSREAKATLDLRGERGTSQRKG